MATDETGEELARLRAEVEELRRELGELAEWRRRARFEAIEVERLDVVEPDGALRLAIAGRARTPSAVVDGVTLAGSGQRAGMIFFNDEGDECGGLVFRGRREGGHYAASGSLTFDQFRQDQVVGVQHGDADGRRWAGLFVWDRPDVPLPEQVARHETMRRLPEGPERTAALRALYEEGLEPREVQRVFVGKEADRAAVVRLADAKRRVRLRLSVDAAGTPALEFLDERGQVVCRLPDALQGTAESDEGSEGAHRAASP